MEVSILTMHRVLNYGSFMQAYALKQVIESFGHHVVFKDFYKGEPYHIGTKAKVPGVLDKISKIPQIISNFDEFVKHRALWREYNKNYKEICWPLLDVSETPDYDLTGDVMVIGSDEVFNYTQNHAFGYVPCLFGHNINASLIMSYAASAGYADWNDVIADGMVDEIGAGLSRMKYISVRDENTRLLVEHCTGSSPTLALDPTLLYDYDGVMSQKRIINEDYILIYAYEGRTESESEVDAIRDFAARHKLKVISGCAYHAWCDDNVAVVWPFDLLSLIRDAAFVVTDTFHGSIFSMKFAKQFAAFLRGPNEFGSNYNKVHFLLHQFGMESRIITEPSDISDILTTPAPCDVFDKHLHDLRQTSLDFLSKALRPERL
ncbi:MAG: polysaccharide pyruvyl transferase family protein [Methylobacter sp.]